MKQRRHPCYDAVLLRSIMDGASRLKIDDAAITTKVKAAMVREPSLHCAEISVETLKGVVQLGGFVSCRADITSAVGLAHGIYGVKSVRDEIRIR